MQNILEKENTVCGRVYLFNDGSYAEDYCPMPMFSMKRGIADVHVESPAVQLSRKVKTDAIFM